MRQGDVDARLVWAVTAIGLMLGCGDPDCKETYYGGGEVQVELSGDLEAVVTIPGYDDDELATFAKATDLRSDPTEVPDGAGLLQVANGAWRLQASTQVPAGTITGCEGVSRVAVAVGNEPTEGALTLGSEGLATALSQVQEGQAGSAQFSVQGFVEGSTCLAPGVSVSVDVTWAFDDEPTLTKRKQCPRDSWRVF